MKVSWAGDLPNRAAEVLALAWAVGAEGANFKVEDEGGHAVRVHCVGHDWSVGEPCGIWHGTYAARLGDFVLRPHSHVWRLVVETAIENEMRWRGPRIQ